MKRLIMGDCHLKPWMFYRAEEVMKETGAQRLVFLGDLADDWNKPFSVEAYENYLWQRRETGYSPIAAGLAARKLGKLKEVLPEENPPAFV